MRNLADAIVVYEQQYKLRYEAKEMPPLQILADARHVLSVLKDKVKFTVGKCLRKHPALLSSSEFKKRHAAKFLQPYGSQTMLYQVRLRARLRVRLRVRVRVRSGLGPALPLPLPLTLTLPLPRA